MKDVAETVAEVVRACLLEVEKEMLNVKATSEALADIFHASRADFIPA